MTGMTFYWCLED